MLFLSTLEDAWAGSSGRKLVACQEINRPISQCCPSQTGSVLYRSRLGLCQFGWVWSTVCVFLGVNAEVMVFDLGCLLSDWFGELLSRQKHSGLVSNQLMSWVILIWAMWSENATWLGIDWGGLKKEAYGWVMLEKDRVAVWTSTAQLIDLQGTLYLRKY